MKRLRILGILVGAVVVLYVVLMLAFQRDLLFPRGMIRKPAEIDVPGREISWLSEKAEVWFLPGEGVSAETPGPLVVFAHGNGELIDFLPPQLQPYRARGFSVLLVEYRGYGRSAGDPSQDAIVADYVEAYDLAAKRPEVDPSRILFHGRSLGGGVVCALSRQRPPAAMILQSTFTSVPDVAPWWAAGFLSLDPFDNIDCIERYEGPTLVLHGTADTLIPVDHAHRLAEHARDATLILDDAGHNDMPPHWEDIQAFVAASVE